MAVYRERDIEDYLLILKRHKWWLVAPFFLFGLAAFGITRFLPNEYRSETLILVERQRIPPEYVQPTVTSDLQDRLQTMTQEILSRTRLQQVIGKFGLFANPSSLGPMYKLAAGEQKFLEKLGLEGVGLFQRYLRRPALEGVVAVMRDNIEIELVRRRGERPGVAAFTVSYTANTAQLAQQVTTELTSLFIEENLKVREQIAENTTQFIEIELDAAREELNQQEATLSEFKTRYMGQLPDQQQVNLQLLGQLQIQLQANMEAMNRLQQEGSYLKIMLRQQEALLNSERDELDPNNLQTKLRQLSAQLRQAQAHYTPRHPDIIKLKEEIAVLQARVDQEPKDAPEETLQANVASRQDSRIVQIQNQLRMNELAMQTRQKEQEKIQDSIKMYQRRVQVAPLREQQYLELTRDYAIAKSNYESLLSKKTLSGMAANLERRQQGEQFRVLDPADLPQTPFRPNRPLISLGGAFGGLFLGVTFVFVREVLDKSLRNERDVALYLEAPILAIIPLATSSGDKWRLRSPLARHGRAAGIGTSRTST